MASSILSTYPYLAGPAKTGQAERDASPLSVEDVKVVSISFSGEPPTARHLRQYYLTRKIQFSL